MRQTYRSRPSGHNLSEPTVRATYPAALFVALCLVRLAVMPKEVQLANLFSPARQQLAKEFGDILRTNRTWSSPTPESAHGFQAVYR